MGTKKKVYYTLSGVFGGCALLFFLVLINPSPNTTYLGLGFLGLVFILPVAIFILSSAGFIFLTLALLTETLESQKNKKGLLSVLVVTIIILLGVAIYLVLTGRRQTSFRKLDTSSSFPVQDVRVPATTSMGATKDWKTYKREKYGFEVKYPPELFTDEMDSSFMLMRRPKEVGEQPFLSFSFLASDI